MKIFFKTYFWDLQVLRTGINASLNCLWLILSEYHPLGMFMTRNGYKVWDNLAQKCTLLMKTCGTVMRA